MDDFFDSEPQQQNQQFEQTYDQIDMFSNQNQSNQNFGFQAQTEYTQFSKEDQMKKEKLRLIEQERLELLQQKQSQELKLKNEIRQKAKEEIRKFEQERQQALVQRKKINQDHQKSLIEAQNQVTYNNQWEKVTDNIDLKNDDAGTKSRLRMKQAILAKKAMC